MNDDLISREALKQAIEKYRPKSAVKSLFLDGEHCMFMNCITEIDNAPTVEPFEPDYVGSERLQARQRGYEEGYHYGMAIGKTLNPKIKQGEWIYHEDPDYSTEDDCTIYYSCSVCGRKIYSSTVNEKDYPFCHCGAVMRGGAE